MNVYEDTSSEDLIADNVLRLFSACNNMFLSSEMHLKDKNELLASQKEKLEHVKKTLFKTMCFRLMNKNKEELHVKVMPNRGYEDYLLDSVCHSEVFRQLTNGEHYPNCTLKL